MPLGLDSLIAAGLSRPAQNVNDFLNRAASRITRPIEAASRAIRTAANPYVKKTSLAAMNEVGDPVLSCDWIAAILGNTSSGQIDPVYIDTFTSPNMSIASAETYVNGKMRKTAGAVSVDSITISLFTDVNGVAINWAWDWWQSVARLDGYFNLPSRYRRDVVLYMMDPKQQTVVDFRFLRCWPIAYNSYDLTGDSASIVKTQLTLSVDDVRTSSSNDLTAVSAKIRSLVPQLPTLSGLAGL